MENDERFRNACRAAGRAIRELRLARGLTQEDLALSVGVGWRHLQKVEAGEVNLTLKTLSRFAAALQVDIPQFFNEATRSKPNAEN